MLDENERNDALEAEDKYKTAVESANDYIENFDILETITNVGNDEVFTPRKTCDMILDSLPEEVWHNPNYKWLNPATKNGIFEREIAIRLDDGLKDIIPNTEQRRKHILQNMIYSIGQTRFTANVARRTVYYCSQANRKCDGIKADDGHYVNGYAIGNGSWFDDEEGNIKTPNINHTFVDDKGKTMPSSCSGEGKKKYRCKYCGINGASAYNDANQRETYAYEFIHFDGDELLKHLQDRFFGGNRNMKFDIIIGKPPYQLSTNQGGTQATPIYQNFVKQAVNLNPRYISMIIPCKWFAGGMSTLEELRTYMMSCHKIKSITDFSNAKECFPTNSVGGGVCYFLWERDYGGPCTFTNVINGKAQTENRELNEFPVLVRLNKAVSILKKIRALSEENMVNAGSPLMPFGLPSDVRGEKCQSKENPVKLHASNGITFIAKSQIKKGQDLLDKYKVLVGILGAEHALEPDKDGKFRIITSSLKVIGPQEACTHSYFTIGKFENLEEAQNLYNYLKTKFARFLILLAMTSTHLSRNVLLFLPRQNFDSAWTDQILYKKYGFTSDEINLIEETIKEMK